MKFSKLLVSSLLLISCSGDEDRQENLLKLRGLGASSEPLVSLPSEDVTAPRKVEVVVYVALPLGQTATIEPFEDEFSPFVVNLGVSDIEVDVASLNYEEYPGFQVFTFKASLNVPVGGRFFRTQGAGQAKYGFLIKSGLEIEKLVGTFLVYPEGSPELNWTNPDVTLVTPTEGLSLQSGADVDLSATFVDKNNEELKIGWFTSGGKVKNRRSKSTSWKTPDSGDHSVIFTARGRKSRAFTMQILKVRVE